MSRMTVKERLGIIKRTIKLIETADKGHIRRNFIGKLPGIIFLGCVSCFADN